MKKKSDSIFFFRERNNFLFVFQLNLKNFAELKFNLLIKMI